MAELAVKITKEMDESAWRDARRQGLGGSDMAAVLGESPWRTPLDVYLDKLGLVPEREPTPAMRRGTVLEPVAADEYARLTGKRLQRGHAGLPVGILRHESHPWMQMNLDRVVMGERTIAEIKCPGIQVFARIKRQGVPADIYIQGQHYLAVSEYEKVLFIIFNAERWEVLPVEVVRDEIVIRHIIEAGKRFWHDHVLAQVPPPEIAEQGTDLDLPEVGGDLVVIDDPGWQRAAAELREAREIMEAAGDLEEAAKARLQEIMTSRNAQVAEGAGLRVYWAPQAGRNSLDSRRLKKERPEVYEQYLKQSRPSRPFRPFWLRKEAA